MPNTLDFQKALTKMLQNAQAQGLSYVDVKAGDLHHYVGDYPGSNHRMPACCNAMRRMMKSGDEVLHAPPSGLGANLKIRYRLPRIGENITMQNPNVISMRKHSKPLEENLSMKFERLAGKVLSKHFGVPLTRGKIPEIPKEFDMTSPDGQIVGDAKYLTMVRGKRLPPAKFSVIAEYVWLLEKSPATYKFLVFGNDRRVPEEWLKRYGHLIENVVFFFLDERTQKLEKLNQ
jgi:hypothetical protein